MIDPSRLLADLQRLLKRLEDDIRVRVQESPSIDARLLEQYDKAKAASRTAQSYEVWRDDYITQVAVAWILGCVFIRFLEDNGLIDAAWLSGPGERLQLARDQQTFYFQRYPSHSDREYLEYVFAEVAKLPSMRDLLDGNHNPLTKLGPTGDGAHELAEFWQKIDPATGALIHDFTDRDWNTRFLGNLYQDLSASARERYALLQTPEFVEEFILDRTLNPAIEESGSTAVTMIDPACGSGHFLLGGFRRLLDLRMRLEPAVPVRAQVQGVLDQVYGVDVNPFAVAIARFRLLMAGLQCCGVKKLADAPAFQINLAAGDSLLHGPKLGEEKDRVSYLHGMDPLQHIYETEDAEELRRILGRQYHVVVGNPPYITVKDAALNAEYRKRFGSCHRQYSLAVPFMERLFHLAHNPHGYVGMITANSFMKREFGKKLVESYIPKWDITHVIDTAGAYIPGHGTPTVVLFGRNRRPVGETIRTVMGIRGEPQTPIDPAHGLVWTAIRDQVDHPGSESVFVSVADSPRASFHRHPWSIGGGGAAELKAALDRRAPHTLINFITEIGRTTHTGEDDAFYFPGPAAKTIGLINACVPLVLGEEVRDYSILPATVSVFPYDKSSGEPVPISDLPTVIERHFWRLRVTLNSRYDYGQTPTERGLRWFDHSMFFKHRYRTPLSIAFAFVATHNHFVLDRGGKVFNRSAPVIKLPEGASEDDHLALVGLLNSSTACFWMKQVFYPKGGDHVGTEGARIRRTFWDERFEHDGTKLEKFPVPAANPLRLGKLLDAMGSERSNLLPVAVAAAKTPTRGSFAETKAQASALSGRMISLQEELDWQCYLLYGLLDETLVMPEGSTPPIHLGERAFEIVMARKMAAGDLETAWFDRHGSTPITEIPEHWPEDYRRLVERRIEVIETNRDIALIEQPEYKRRWNMEPWDEQERRAIRNWLLERMENKLFGSSLELSSCARLADCLQADAEFRQVAELYRGRPDFDWTALLTELVEAESVPFLAVLRYTDGGPRKRAAWERTWDLQRAEDRIDAEVQADVSIPESLKVEVAKNRKADEIGDVPPPPKYETKDFRKSSYWGLRGKLDVPKERFVLFPHCERDVDSTPVIAWAGWDHLQLAQAIAAYYERVKNHEGWTPQRRMPLLAGILELLPWLKQWHNEIHPEFHERMGDFFEQFVQDEARATEVTVEQIRAWTPPAQNGQGRRRRNSQ
jgi:hypothetical protein